MEFKDWIESLMQRRGINATQLAQGIKENQPTLQRVLSGETKNPGLRIVKKLESYFQETYMPHLTYKDEYKISHDLLLKKDIIDLIKSLDSDERELLKQLIEDFLTANQEQKRMFVTVTSGIIGVSNTNKNIPPELDVIDDAQEKKRSPRL